MEHVTVSWVPKGYFSASVIGTNGNLTLMGANATTGQITIQAVTAFGAEITVSMGTGLRWHRDGDW